MFFFMKYFNLCLLISRLTPVVTGNIRILSKDMVLSNYKVPKGVSIHTIFL
jgi:cytochrome P450